MSLAGSEIFSLDELNQLNMAQLNRVMKYLDITFPSKPTRDNIINSILEFQRSHQRDYQGNPDWKPGIQRSVRVQRLYELNVLGKKL